MSPQVTPLKILAPRALPFPRPIHPYRPPEPHAIVERVHPGSIAEEIGLEPLDEVVSINGQRMEDVIDYRFLIADEEVELVVAPGGDRSQQYAVEISKELDETLGVTFTADVFDGIRICTNNCDFCFVYQNRRRMRKSVYIKDDDYRLSFLHGDFITLTNLTEQCWDRIIRYNLSPLHVSIHATDPDVRVTMLRNPDGALLAQHLDRLFRHGIQIHGQVVLTPGMNDGDILDRTIETMAGYHKRGCLTLAVVPVGLTHHRNNLPDLRTVSPVEAGGLIRQIRGWQKRLIPALGTRFVFPSDEMFLLAGDPLPGARYYEGFPQAENGVGMISRLQGRWRRLERQLPNAVEPARRRGVVTGTLAAPVLSRFTERLNQIEGVQVRVLPVVNRFFGESVTVAGLMAGEDLVDQLRGQVSDLDSLVIPDIALRDGVFIDDWTLEGVAEALGRPVRTARPDANGLISAALDPP